ncbi:MAG TPA: transporter [Saprospiraceae bacterium]|nr:transporter [Saprospiraceae bacterium]
MRKFTLLFILLFSLPFAFISRVSAQTPTDGIMMSKGEICFGFNYVNESWDEYWEGTLLRSNGNIGTFTRTTWLPMVAYGITDKINLLVQAPYVSTEASGGQLLGSDGFSDFGAYLKFQAFHLDLGPGKLAFNPGVGFSLPMSNYLEDYQPFSLGLGCPGGVFRANLQYKLNMGLYVRGTYAYELRGTSTIERSFYYDTHGNYSDKVDIPNAFNYTATIGAWLFNNSLNVDVTYDGQTTDGGFDIRRQDMPFPSNKMNFSRIGVFAHYYFNNLLPGLGVLGGVNQVQEGRNVGKAMGYYFGLTYQFLIGNNGAGDEPIQN